MNGHRPLGPDHLRTCRMGCPLLRLSRRAQNAPGDKSACRGKSSPLRKFLRSKEKNEAATRAASLEPPVSVGRALTWIGGSDTQADCPRLNQLAQSIKLLELAVVGAHERGREPDAPLWSALKPAHCSECAAVAHGWNYTLVEHGPVGKAIDPRGEVLANTGSHIGASRDHHMSAE